MAVESIDIQIGTQMPTFKLKDPLGKIYNSEKLYGEKEIGRAHV